MDFNLSKCSSFCHPKEPCWITADSICEFTLMQTLNINLTALSGAKSFTAKDGTAFIAIPIEANNLHVGAKGTYMGITLMDNRDGPDQYGNDGFATLDIGKQRREAGERGPILGNWKHMGQRQAPPAATPKAAKPEPEEADDVPF
jgi:hypothetical protein